MTRSEGIIIACLGAAISGCSGLRAYHSDLENNLQITTKTDSGSIFSSVEAAVDVHRVNPDCSTEYSGTVKLGETPQEIGIPTGRSSYLVFVFEKSGIFSAETMTTYNTLVRPRAGYQYVAQVSYKENLYNVILNEIDPGSRKSREVEPKGLQACRPV